MNDEFLPHVRSGKVDYIRCTPTRLTSRGVLVEPRKGDEKSSDEDEWEVQGDIVVFATGFEKPKIDFLEDGLFPEGYERPNLYLQNFSTEDWSVLMTNSAYQNAIGTVYVYVYMLLRDHANISFRSVFFNLNRIVVTCKPYPHLRLIATN